MRFVLMVLVNAAALWVAVTMLDGLDFAGEWWDWLALALVFGVVNAIVKPVLQILTFPVTIITLGLFLIVVNALMLYLTSWLAGMVGWEFTILSIGEALLGALVVSIVATALNFTMQRSGLR